MKHLLNAAGDRIVKLKKGRHVSHVEQLHAPRRASHRHYNICSRHPNVRCGSRERESTRECFELSTFDIEDSNALVPLRLRATVPLQNTRVETARFCYIFIFPPYIGMAPSCIRRGSERYKRSMMSSSVDSDSDGGNLRTLS